MASQRAELAEQVANAQADLEGRLSDIRHDSAQAALAENQLAALARLQHRISRADKSLLSALRAEATAYIAATQTLTQSGATTARLHSTEAALHSASEAARAGVHSFMDDYYGKRIFDPYLTFTSQTDEEEYRRREADRQREIEKALAEGTPESILRANQLAIEQMKDAGAHGADQSPEFRPRFDALTARSEALRAALPPQQQMAREAPADPLANLDTLVSLPTELLASLGATGVALTDPATKGHGVDNRAVAAAAAEGRSA